MAGSGSAGWRKEGDDEGICVCQTRRQTFAQPTPGVGRLNSAKPPSHGHWRRLRTHIAAVACGRLGRVVWSRCVPDKSGTAQRRALGWVCAGRAWSSASRHQSSGVSSVLDGQCHVPVRPLFDGILQSISTRFLCILGATQRVWPAHVKIVAHGTDCPGHCRSGRDCSMGPCVTTYARARVLSER